MSFHDLQAFVRALERTGDLRRVSVEVDPALEITEIASRVVGRGGPALLFENVRGGDFPLLINPLGSERRIELALGRSPASIGHMLLELAERMNPPSPAALWRARGSLAQLLAMRTRRAWRAPCRQIVEDPRLGTLPVQTCWPEDGGPFITFGLVFTRDPETGERNVGLYRIQVYDDVTTGMHWQIQKGGGFHYARAERLDRPLEVAVVIGADPALILAAVTALPEGMDEVAFAGLLRGSPTRMVRCATIGLEVPANAEIVLEGVVPPGERRLEGPFGDHFGHYSHAAPFPVFHVRRLTRKRRPLYLSAVVGRPPQEDKYLGNATQEIVGPLIKVIHPEIDDLWAYFEAGFHNLLVVAVRQRYHKEAVKTALALLGTGQLALTKCLILVDEGVPVRDFDAVLREVGAHFRPERDFLMIPGVPMDTLDFTSYSMNLGSKMVLDATSGPGAGEGSPLHARPGADRRAVREALEAAGAGLDVLDASDASPAGGPDGGPGPAAGGADTSGSEGERLSPERPPDPREIDPRVEAFRVIEDALMVVRVTGGGREVVDGLVARGLGPVRLVAAVSSDVPLDDDDLLLWGVFTRFDCARDVVFSRHEHRGPWTCCHGLLGIDATFKPGYPNRLVMPDEIVERVDARWRDYGVD